MLDLRSTPKVELHRHLEGALRLSTIVELSRQAGIPLPADTVEALAPYALATQPVAGLEEALAKFEIAQNSVRTYEAVRRISREAVEDLAADDVRLAELRFSPEFLCSPGGLDWDGAMEAIKAGLDDARSKDVTVGLIVIFSRNYGPDSGRRTVEFALRHPTPSSVSTSLGPNWTFRPACTRAWWPRSRRPASDLRFITASRVRPRTRGKRSSCWNRQGWVMA